tara:strand:- start:8623 stop:9036 length:414 start_codon:yes stop_codon:yes gene_type:complete
MGAWYTKININKKVFLDSSLKDDINDIIFCIGIIKGSKAYRKINKRIEIINNILLDIENKLYLDPTDMHDLHMLIVYKKPEIKTFYIVLKEAEWLDHWDRIINALIRIEKNITEDDYTYYNTFVSIREEITKFYNLL